MSTETNPTGTPTSAQLERSADEARNRLLMTVDALDAKRHAISEPSKPVATPRVPPDLLIPASVAVAGAVGLAVSSQLGKRSGVDAFLHGRNPLWSSVLQKVSFSLLTFGLIELGKAGAKHVVKKAQEPGNAR